MSKKFINAYFLALSMLLEMRSKSMWKKPICSVKNTKSIFWPTATVLLSVILSCSKAFSWKLKNEQWTRIHNKNKKEQQEYKNFHMYLVTNSNVKQWFGQMSFPNFTFTQVLLGISNPTWNYRYKELRKQPTQHWFKRGAWAHDLAALRKHLIQTQKPNFWVLSGSNVH